MPSDPKRPAKPTWRQQGNPQQQRRPEAQKAWRKETPADKPLKTGWSRKKRFGLAFVGLLLGAGLLIGLILMLRTPKGACLVLIGEAYEDNLAIPHNVYGMQGLADLAKPEISKPATLADSFSWSDSGDLRRHGDPQRLGPNDPWTKGWDDVKQQTVLIFLALHGGADSAGPYFLRDAKLGDGKEKQRLPMGKVLDDLTKLKDKNIVLILDATQVTDNAPLGMLHNDFMRQLKEDKWQQKIATVPNLVIIQASDEEQRSWVSEEWRQTIFAHYVIEGLRGGACSGGTGPITARQLYDYVRDEVTKWVQINRNDRQIPLLIDPHNRASGIELAVIKQQYQPPDPAVVEQAPGHGPLPPELAKTWQEYRDLANRPLRPYVHSPHLWRQYTETLLRYEQLLRAGDATGKAAAVGASADDLLAKMRAAERDLQTKLPSIAYALPLSQTLGLTSPWQAQEKDLREKFDQVWTADNDKQGDAFNKAREWAGSSESNARLLRLEFDRLSLNKVISTPTDASLKTALNLAKLYHDSDYPRPAEINFLAVLGSESDQPHPDQETIRQALSLRRQAEEVALAARTGDDPTAKTEHPYSEWIYSWTKADVEEADKARRLGEDLLFSSQDTDWTDAKAYFVKAKVFYDRAADDAVAVRAALNVRDQALAELPGYTNWLRGRDNVNEAEIEELENLWLAVHNVSDALDPQPKTPRPQPERARLKALTDLVTAGLETQRKKFQQSCSSAAQRSDYQQQKWREAEQVLSVPPLPDETGVIGERAIETRTQILKNSRSISDELNIRTSQAGTTVPAAATATAPLKLAQKQGRLSLASLGQSVVDRLSHESQKAIPEFSELSRAVKNAGGGEEIGDCFRLLPIAIADLATKSRAKDGDAQSSLHQADRLAREVDGAGAAQIKGSPPDEYRRFRLQGLLLWMAQRALHDHWWSDGQAYYRAACNAFLSDGRDIAPDRSTDDIRKLRAQLDAAQELSVADTLPEYWFTDTGLNLKYTLNAPAGLEPALPGFPVRRINLKRLKPSDSAPDGRLAIRKPNGKEPLAIADSKPLSIDLRYPVQLAEGGSGDPEAKLEVFYRGWRTTPPTIVHVQRDPDTRFHEFERPDNGEFAARVDESAYQASLVIVLDCSGSMLTSRGKPVDEKQYTRKTSCRYHRATTALRKVLPTIEEGTRVTVLVFGHAERKDVSEAILENEAWHKDDPNQLSRLMDKLEPLTPMGYSPIVDTMVKAQKEYLKDFSGLKTVLVLTDGNDEDKNGVTDSKITTNKIMDAYDRSGVTVNVVFFEIDDGEYAAAEKQFKIVEGLNPRGNLYRVNLVRSDSTGNDDDEKTAKQLADRIERILRPKVRILKRGGGLVDDMPVQGHPVTFAREPNPNWFKKLSPQMEYTASLPDASTQNFDLERGDRLFATIKKGKDNKLYLERILYSDHAKRYLAAPPEHGGNWQLAVLQNEWKSHELNRVPFLQLMITAEDEQHRTISAGDSLRLNKPRFMWLEVMNQADKAAKPLRLDWGNLAGYPAAAWTVDVPDWKASAQPEAKPLVRAWLLTDRDPPSAASPTRKPNVELKDDFREPIQVGKQKRQEVFIDSVQFELRRSVEVRPGEREVKDCVVVHLRHDPDMTVLVQLGGLNPKAQGAEHYFYDKAAKYTAVFWGVKEEQLNAANFFINVISLGDVKNEAKQLVLLPLDTPNERARPGAP